MQQKMKLNYYRHSCPVMSKVESGRKGGKVVLSTVQHQCSNFYLVCSRHPDSYGFYISVNEYVRPEDFTSLDFISQWRRLTAQMMLECEYSPFINCKFLSEILKTERSNATPASYLALSVVLGIARSARSSESPLPLSLALALPIISEPWNQLLDPGLV